MAAPHAIPNTGDSAIVASEASPGQPSLEERERMARRRFQAPRPKREGAWWYIRLWQDVLVGGKQQRKQTRIKLAPASVPYREAQKIAEERLSPMNHGLQALGSACSFTEYVETTYKPVVLPLLARTTQDCYQGVIRKHLKPSFSAVPLRDMTALTLQRFFSQMAVDRIARPSIMKVRDALSSVLRSAVQYELLTKNPMDGLRLPPDRKGRRPKPHISPEQFAQLVELVPEPYATMIYVAVWTGLRVSELLGLKWHCIHADSITIEERFCRGDWAAPKTNASAATIGVEPHVIDRIHRLKTLTVVVRAGCAKRCYRVVKSDGPDDLVFQSVQDGKPMRDGNILRRFIKPAARAIGVPAVNWRCLRTSHATWMCQAGADPKSIQGQMRHACISTTMDIYAQIVPAAQRSGLQKLTAFAKEAVTEPVTLLVQ